MVRLVAHGCTLLTPLGSAARAAGAPRAQHLVIGTALLTYDNMMVYDLGEQREREGKKVEDDEIS